MARGYGAGGYGKNRGYNSAYEQGFGRSPQAYSGSRPVQQAYNHMQPAVNQQYGRSGSSPPTAKASAEAARASVAATPAEAVITCSAGRHTFGLHISSYAGAVMPARFPQGMSRFRCFRSAKHQISYLIPNNSFRECSATLYSADRWQRARLLV
jgi:hypothetical protein